MGTSADISRKKGSSGAKAPLVSDHLDYLHVCCSMQLDGFCFQSVLVLCDLPLFVTGYHALVCEMVFQLMYDSDGIAFGGWRSI